MRLSIAAALVAAALLPAFAGDMDSMDAMDEAPPQQPTQASDDAKFVAYDQPVIAFVHVEVIDGTGAPPKYDQTVVIVNGRIAGIAPTGRGPFGIAKGGIVIDGHGKTLIPGFVMVHEHLFYPTGKSNYASLIYSFPRMYLAAGLRYHRAVFQRGRPADPDHAHAWRR